MKKILVYCDHCKSEIVGLDRSNLFDNLLKSVDLCQDCGDKLWKIVHEFVHEFDEPEEDPEPFSEPEPTPEPKKKPARKRLELDLGKIGALREAGWEIGRIAEEIGCHPQTIRNHLPEAMELLRKIREKQGLERREA